MKKIVLAYSGGLDTSIAIAWLKERYTCEVVAMAADVGQGEELASLEGKALSSGAGKLYIEDIREEFLRDFVFPMLQAGALYEQKYLLGTAIARPAIAKALVKVALQEGADAVAHGATGKGNDQVRFELTVKALAPHLKIVAPWREWEIRSRDDAFDYAEKRGIPVPVTKSKPYSMDRNIWHLSYEGGVLEDPDREPDREMFLLTADPAEAPDQPEFVEIDFVKGIPSGINGETFTAVELLTRLNALAGKHGVGRVDMVENRLVGIKSRGVYETPGGTLLFLAHRELESLTMDRETMHFKELVASKYGELVYYGQWFTPLR
jgi:argininosuccinate synthase